MAYLDIVLYCLEWFNTIHQEIKQVILAMFREELQSVSFANAPAKEAPPFRTELNEEEKAENDAGILSALAMFD